MVNPTLRLTRGTYDPDYAHGGGGDRPTAQLKWPAHDASTESLTVATRVVVDLSTGE